jgi:hypothetical protein
VICRMAQSVPEARCSARRPKPVLECFVTSSSSRTCCAAPSVTARVFECAKRSLKDLERLGLRATVTSASESPGHSENARPEATQPSVPSRSTMTQSSTHIGVSCARAKGVVWIHTRTPCASAIRMQRGQLLGQARNWHAMTFLAGSILACGCGFSQAGEGSSTRSLWVHRRANTRARIVRSRLAQLLWRHTVLLEYVDERSRKTPSTHQAAELPGGVESSMKPITTSS